MIIDTAQVILDLRFWIADWRGRSPLAASQFHPKPHSRGRKSEARMTSYQPHVHLSPRWGETRRKLSAVSCRLSAVRPRRFDIPARESIMSAP